MATKQPSFEEYLIMLNSHIPEILVPKSNLSKIKEIGRELPLLSFAALECWLGAIPPRTDINISISGILQENKRLVNWLKSSKKAGDDKKNRVFNKYSNFCSRWSQFDFYLVSFINQFWLVYDFPTDQKGQVLPWYYLSFMENSLARNPLIKSEIVLQILKLFKEKQVVQDFETTWRPFLNNIPESMILNTIGVQTNRSVDYLRIYLSIFSFKDLLRYLRGNNWPGDVDDLEEQMGDLVKECSLFGLSIDCEPALQEKISIELWFTQESSGKKKALRNLSDKLVDLGLLSAEEQEAFANWEGDIYLDEDPQKWSWPENHPIELKSREILIRKMYYFKIVYIPGQQIKAKGYLCFDRPVLAV